MLPIDLLEPEDRRMFEWAQKGAAASGTPFATVFSPSDSVLPPRDRRYAARPMAKVELTKHLFQFFPQLEGKELVVEAATVADVVRGLERIAPGFAFYVCDERGRLRQHVNMFIGEEP